MASRASTPIGDWQDVSDWQDTGGLVPADDWKDIGPRSIIKKQPLPAPTQEAPGAYGAALPADLPGVPDPAPLPDLVKKVKQGATKPTLVDKAYKALPTPGEAIADTLVPGSSAIHRKLDELSAAGLPIAGADHTVRQMASGAGDALKAGAMGVGDALTYGPREVWNAGVAAKDKNYIEALNALARLNPTEHFGQTPMKEELAQGEQYRQTGRPWEAAGHYLAAAIPGGSMASQLAEQAGGEPLMPPKQEAGKPPVSRQVGPVRPMDPYGAAGNLAAQGAIAAGMDVAQPYAKRAYGHFFEPDPYVAAARVFRPRPSNEGFLDRLPEAVSAIKAAAPGFEPQYSKGNFNIGAAAQHTLDTAYEPIYQQWMDRADGQTASLQSVIDKSQDFINRIPDKRTRDFLNDYYMNNLAEDYGGRYSAEDLRNKRSFANDALDAYYDRPERRQDPVRGSEPELALLKLRRDEISGVLNRLLDPMHEGRNAAALSAAMHDIIDIRDTFAPRRSALVAEQPLDRAEELTAPIKAGIQTAKGGNPGSMWAYSENARGKSLPVLKRLFDAAKPEIHLPTPETPIYPPDLAGPYHEPGFSGRPQPPELPPYHISALGIPNKYNVVADYAGQSSLGKQGEYNVNVEQDRPDSIGGSHVVKESFPPAPAPPQTHVVKEDFSRYPITSQQALNMAERASGPNEFDIRQVLPQTDQLPLSARTSGTAIDEALRKGDTPQAQRALQLTQAGDMLSKMQSKYMALRGIDAPFESLPQPEQERLNARFSDLVQAQQDAAKEQARLNEWGRVSQSGFTPGSTWATKAEQPPLRITQEALERKQDAWSVEHQTDFESLPPDHQFDLNRLFKQEISRDIVNQQIQRSMLPDRPIPEGMPISDMPTDPNKMLKYLADVDSITSVLKNKRAANPNTYSARAAAKAFSKAYNEKTNYAARADELADIAQKLWDYQDKWGPVTGRSFESMHPIEQSNLIDQWMGVIEKKLEKARDEKGLASWEKQAKVGTTPGSWTTKYEEAGPTKEAGSSLPPIVTVPTKMAAEAAKRSKNARR